MKKEINLELYKKIVENIPIPSVDILIFNKKLDRTLLFLRNNSPAKNEYYSIGGRLVKGESFLEGALNNFNEETGIKLKEESLHYIGIQDEFFKDSFFSEKVFTHNLNIYFAIKFEQDLKIKLDNQHSSSKWFKVNDKNLHPYMKEKIKKSLEYFENGKKE